MRRQNIFEKILILSKKVQLEDIAAGFNGFSAQEIGDTLEIERANCSRELNKLYRQKQVIKIPGKPVLFFPVKRLEEILFKKVTITEADSLSAFLSLSEDDFLTNKVFENMIGYNGSLKNVIAKAKAAMIYPPDGLHTLILGDTGAGKTMLAEYMYNYAKGFGALSQNSKMVVFNCAEYADNPQLLLSQLFGYKKGAFSGADEDKDGLVARAKDGILFLDEVHRLPPEGQEMLFLLMDKGLYRKLGETDALRKINLLIIAATSENITSSLLTTFIRRFSMTLNLPKLSERPLKERLELIIRFFENESCGIDREIILTRWSLTSLLGYDCLGNIGQLQSDIKLISANAYLNAMLSKSNELVIEKNILPSHIIHGMINRKNKNEAETLLKRIGKKDLHLLPNRYEVKSNQNENNGAEVADIYKSIEKRYFEIAEKNEIDYLKNEMYQYISELFAKSNTRLNNQQEIFKIVDPKTYHAVESSLNIAEKIINRKLSKQTYLSLSVHIKSVIDRNSSASRITKDMRNVEETHPAEFEAAKIIHLYLTNELKFDFTEEERYIVALFLTMDLKNIEKEKKIGVLLLAHGDSTAASIARVVNKLLDTDHIHALDMPLEESVQTFYKKVENLVQKIDQGKGIMLIIDMGSLVNFGELLISKHDIQVKTLPFLSTPIALEVGRKTMFVDYTLEDVYDEMIPFLPRQQFNQKIFFDSPPKETIVSGEKPLILSSCYTGQGSAVQMINYLKNSLPNYISKYVDFMAINISDFDRNRIYQRNVIACVGTLDLELDGVPFISSEKILLGNGLLQLQNLLYDDLGFVDFKQVKREKSGLEAIVESSLSVISSKLVLKLLKNSFNMIEKDIVIYNFNHTFITFIMHGANMIERIFQGFPYTYIGVDDRIKRNPELYRMIKNSFKQIESKVNIKIPNTEIAYVMDIFDTL